MKWIHLNCVAALLALNLAPWAAAELKLHPEAAAAASKVDSAGSFFEVDIVKEDMDMLLPYADLIGELLAGPDDDGTKPDVRRMLESSGLLDLSAVAKSNARHGSSWINKAYLANGGSRKGLFALVAGDPREFRVARMVPAGTDLAVELRADLSQVPGLIQSMGAALGVSKEAGGELEKQVKHLGMTIGEALGRTAFTLDLAITLETANKGAATFPEPKEMMGRIEGLTWLWDKAGEAMLEESRAKGTLDFTRAETGGVVTYSITASGPTPPGVPTVIVVEAAKDTIWLASSAEFLARSREGASRLVEDPAFQATWKGMPGSGNAMAYISPRMLRAVVDTVLPLMSSLTEALGESGESGDTVNRMLQRMAKDLTASDSGLAFTASRDETGLLAVSKLPLPGKYLDDLFVGDLLYDLLGDPSLFASPDGSVALPPEELEALVEESMKEARTTILEMGLDEKTTQGILDNMEKELRGDLGGSKGTGGQAEERLKSDIQGLGLSTTEVDAELELFLKEWRKGLEKAGFNEKIIDQLVEGTRVESRKELRKLLKPRAEPRDDVPDGKNGR